MFKKAAAAISGFFLLNQVVNGDVINPTKNTEINYVTDGLSIICCGSCENQENYDAIMTKFSEVFPKKKDWQLRGLNFLDLSLTDINSNVTTFDLGGGILLPLQDTFIADIEKGIVNAAKCPDRTNETIGTLQLVPSYYPYEKYPENIDVKDVNKFLLAIRDEVVYEESNNIFAAACLFTTGGVFNSDPADWRNGTDNGNGNGTPLHHLHPLHLDLDHLSHSKSQSQSRSCANSSVPTVDPNTELVYNWTVSITDPLPKTVLPATNSESFLALYSIDYTSLWTYPAICEEYKFLIYNNTEIPESVDVSLVDVRCYEGLVTPQVNKTVPCSGVGSILVSIDYNEHEIGSDQISVLMTYLRQQTSLVFQRPVPGYGTICSRTMDTLELNTFENLESCKTSSSYLFNQKMTYSATNSATYSNKNSKENKSILKKGKKQLQRCTNNQMKDNLNYNRLSKKDKKSFSKSEFKSYKSVTKNLSKNKN